jgi:hypothetical protein
MTTFNKLSSTPSLARQAIYQDVDSTKLFSLSLENSTQWIPFISKEGGLIQVVIAGHPPIPSGSKTFSGNLLFLAVFRFLNFRGHFEGLNEGFLGSSTKMIFKGSN